MTHHARKLFLGTLLLASGAATEVCNAQTTRLIPFDEFYRSIPPAQSAAYIGAAGAANVGAFDEMRQHILGLYKDVRVKHSFLLDESTFDCVPIEQQPSVRLGDVKTVETPPPDLAGADAPTQDEADVSPQATGKDALGNVIGCEEGTIPMRRVTLEEIARFGTLAQFFQKGPGHAGQFTPAAPAVTYTHKYAHSYNFVKNLGGSAQFNIWNPYVNTKEREIFSLEQNWYVNTNRVLQTLENGAQDYPQKYGTTKPVLFIYWTADGYNRTGCYNLDCKAFVQTNRNIFLGGSFAQYSKVGGKQYQIILKNYFYKGKWWIYFNGYHANNIVGYYPVSIYRGGPMSTHANEIDYGGETVGSTVWPPMGGGQFPPAGYGHAAYIKLIKYFDVDHRDRVAVLRVDQPSPACYRDTTHNASGRANFGTYFFFGGPGGRKC